MLEKTNGTLEVTPVGQCALLALPQGFSRIQVSRLFIILTVTFYYDSIRKVNYTINRVIEETMIHKRIPITKGLYPTFFKVAMVILEPIKKSVTTSPCRAIAETT